MPSLLEDLDLEHADADAVETQMKGGGLVPEGMHHAVLYGVRAVTANSGTTGRELVFKVLAGPAAGMELKETVWSPSGKGADTDAKSRNRLRLFGHRLGLLQKVQTADKKHKYEAIKGKHDFADCFGSEVVIEVRHEDDEWTDKNGKQRKGKKSILTFEGVLELTDPRAKDVPRGGAGAARAAVAAAPAPASAPAGAAQFDDI